MKRFTSTKPYATFLLALAVLISTLFQGASARAAEPQASPDAVSVTQTVYPVSNEIAGLVSYLGTADMDWIAASFARIGKPIPASYTNSLKTNIGKDCLSSSTAATDYARYTIAATAVGLDATNVNGCNLIEKITKTASFPTIYGPTYALIALDSGHYSVPEGAVWNRTKLLNEIVSDLGSINPQYRTADLYGMVLSAIGNYRDRDLVKTAGDQAVAWLAANLDDSNSESLSQAILGLATYGVNPLDSQFDKNNKNLIERLLQFRNTDGGFKHVLSATASDRGFASEQALRALIAYDLYAKNAGTLYVYPETLTNAVQVEAKIEGPNGPIQSSVIRGVYALDALDYAAKLNGISITVDQTQYGEYVSAIGGYKQNDLAQYSGWMLIVKRGGEWVAPESSWANFRLQPADVLYYYFSTYGTPIVDSITATPSEPKEGEAVSIQVKQAATTSNHAVTPAANIQVKLGGQTATTNSQGVAVFEGLTAGTYTVEATGYRTGNVPALVRGTSTLTVKSIGVQASVTIEGPNGKMATGSVAHAVYAMDALKAVTEQNHLTLGLKSTDYGDMVTSIGDVAADSHKPTWWGFYIKRDGVVFQPDVGFESFVLKAGDEVVAALVGGDTTSVKSITVVPAQPRAGEALTIEVQQENYLGASPAANVQVKIGTQTVTTNAQGVASFQGLAAGDYTIEITGYRDGNTPSIVRATSTLVVAPIPQTQTVTFSVTGDSQKGTIVPSKSVQLIAGDTPYSILAREVGAGKINSTGSGSTLYVRGIDGLNEFDRGPNSGWIYTINGSQPSMSAGAYILNGGETVAWKYTSDYKNESGGGGLPGLPAAIPAEVGAELGKLTLSSDNTLPVGQASTSTAVLNASSKMSAAEAAELAKKLADAPKVAISQSVPTTYESTLTDPSGKVSFIVPTGAIGTATTIEIQEQSVSSSAYPELVSALFSFTPDGTKFVKPVYLIVKVPVTTGTPANLTLAWLNEATGKWIPVPAVLDAKTGTITGKITHFTKYAVIDSSKVKKDEPKPTPGAFTDEADISSWALSSVREVYAAGLILGVSSTELRFAPKQSISRAEFATLILRVLGEAPQTDVKAVFTDVKPGAWYYDAVMTAQAKGLIQGVSATSFKPNEPISRQDLAVILARAFKLDGSASKTTFKDQAKIGTYALSAVRAVYDQELMVGSNASFSPADKVTREMAAAIVSNLLHKGLISAKQ